MKHGHLSLHLPDETLRGGVFTDPADQPCLEHDLLLMTLLEFYFVASFQKATDCFCILISVLIFYLPKGLVLLEIMSVQDDHESDLLVLVSGFISSGWKHKHMHTS